MTIRTISKRQLVVQRRKRINQDGWVTTHNSFSDQLPD